jgi:hypothetical protein
MRGVIVETKEKKIKDCYITVWFFGSDRGFHGREIRLDGESNLAYLCRDYFDRVFAKGWPQVNPLKQFMWLMRNFWFRIITLGIVPLICLAVWLTHPTNTLPVEIGIGSIIAGLADFINK